ncbi:Laminin G domain protein [Anaerohalosphaera lusitana]|uniref:Laminin G domain protein n=1 Tax=Anaerohalosphaera lusitana TaxID=1936003 RepID=A0A1U9NN68_9BACT|nr:LamG domain-containing protein [Anaerohalosphaera lusitana]AQT68966.1 Laminin G domain protein [Anaerohalosphaera lusitana]
MSFKKSFVPVVNLGRIMRRCSKLFAIIAILLFVSQAGYASLVGHWKLDDGSGSTAASAVDSPADDGAIVGTAAWESTDIPPVPGGNSYALELAAGKGIDTPVNGIPGAGGRTISAWINVDPTASLAEGGGGIVTWGDNWANGLGHRFTFKIDDSSTGRLRVEIGGGYAVGSTSVNDGQWHHVAVTLADGQSSVANVKFYIDGEVDVISDSDTSNPINSDAAPIDIGYCEALLDTWSKAMGIEGGIDDVRVYDHELSEGEILLLCTGSDEPYVYGPSPGDGEDHVSPDAVLSWSAGAVENPDYDVNIGTTMACDEIISGVSTGSATSYVPAAGTLTLGNTYFWRVDVTDGGTEYTGDVWSFTVGAGSATDPVPADGASIVATSAYLDWTGDDFVDSYRIMFAPAGEQLVNAGEYAGAPVGLAKIARAAGMDLLEAGTYDWQVVSLDASGEMINSGPVWSFSIGTDIWVYMLGDYVPVDTTVDDFFSYVSTADLLGTWTDGAANGSNAQATIDAMEGAVTLSYDNTTVPYQSYISRTFASVQDWSGEQVLSVTMQGDSANAGETLFVGLSDGTDSADLALQSEKLVSNDEATTITLALSEFAAAGVDLANVSEMRIGTGDGSTGGAAGSIVVYDVMIHPAGSEEITEPTADLDGDFVVDLGDIALFAEGWAMAEYMVSASGSEPAGLRAEYRFEELGGYVVGDSSGNGLDGSIQRDLTGVWNVDGFDGGCVKLTDGSSVVLPASVFDGVDGFTMSFWMSQTTSAGVGMQAFTVDSVGLDASYELTNTGFYDGSWHHIAIVNDAINARVELYVNGLLVAGGDAGSTAEAASETVIEKISDNAFGSTVDKIDSVSVYSRALDHSEIVRLYGGAGASVMQPVNGSVTVSDLNGDGRVDLEDYAELIGSMIQRL